jgi:hypothetical protein
MESPYDRCMSHPHLKRAWIEWIDERDAKGNTNRGFIHPVLVVETDLNLVPGRNTLDSSTLEDIIDEAKAQFENRILKIDRIRVVPAGMYGPQDG